MNLYIRCDLVKGTSPVKASAASPAKVKQPRDAAATKTTGEQRGGKYVARIQIGYDKDGSPKYRYFKSQDEYKEYKERKSTGGSKRKKKDNPHNLKQKVEREHKESKEKQGTAPQTAGSDPLKDNKKVSKGLFVRLT